MTTFNVLNFSIRQLVAIVLTIITFFVDSTVDCSRHRRRRHKSHLPYSPFRSTKFIARHANRRREVGKFLARNDEDDEMGRFQKVYSKAPGWDNDRRREGRHMTKGGRRRTRLATRADNRRRGGRGNRSDSETDSSSEESSSLSNSSFSESDNSSSSFSSNDDSESTDQDSNSSSTNDKPATSNRRTTTAAFHNTNPRIQSRDQLITPPRRGQAGNLAVAPLLNRPPASNPTQPTDNPEPEGGLMQVNDDGKIIKGRKRSPKQGTPSQFPRVKTNIHKRRNDDDNNDTSFTPPTNADQLSIWDVIHSTKFSNLIRSQAEAMKGFLKAPPTPDPLTNIDRKWILYLPTDHAVAYSDFVGKEKDRVLNHLTVAPKGSMRYPVMPTASKNNKIIVDTRGATVESGVYPPARIISTIKCNNGEIRVIDSMLGLPTFMPPHLLLEQSTLKRTLELLGKAAIKKNDWTIFVYPAKQFNDETYMAHVIPGLHPTGEFNKTLTTADNKTLYLEQDLDNMWKVNGQYIRQPDLLAKWGIVHYLDEHLDLSYQMPMGPIGADDSIEVIVVEGDVTPLPIQDDTKSNAASSTENNSWLMGIVMALIAIILA